MNIEEINLLIGFIVGIIAGVIIGMSSKNKALRNCGVLTGKDAKRFLEAIENPEKAPPEEIERIKKNYEAINSVKPR